MSPYTYGLGNPIRFSDPTGMIEEDQDGLMSVSTSLWGRDVSGGENSGAVLDNQFVSAGQLERDTDTYTFNEHAGEEISRAEKDTGVDITYKGAWLKTGSGSSLYNWRTGSGSTIQTGSGASLFRRILGVREEENVVHQFGFTGSFSCPMGLLFSVGFVWDNKNTSYYSTVGFNHGMDISLGFEYIQSRSINNNTSFNINSLNGVGITNNLGILNADFSYGGDTKGVGNYGEKVGASYNSYTLGASVGPIPAGFTRSIEYTKVY